jgi:Na+/melibiose symporter-like transporter
MLSASWYKIIGLAALQGAISLTWLIYNIYLPKLLVSYGFSPGLAVLLLIIENAIAVFLEPLFGSLSDRAYRWLATKFGIISFGVILTSAISISIPAIIIFGDLSNAVKWIIPGILIAWAMAMTVFRTPAISLVGRYAFASELPIAMSFLTLAGGFIAALQPIFKDFILEIGPAFAFAVSSIVLLAATGLLRYFDPGMNDDLPVTKRQPIPFANIGLLMGMGWGLAWGSRALFETLPKIIKLNLPQVNPILAMIIISLAIAISALPAGIFASKNGNQRTMLIGIVTTLIGLLIMVFLPSVITTTIAIVLFICCFSWATNGAIPLAINLFPADRMGLAVGLYFSGVTGGLSSFSSLFNPIANLTPLWGAICGSIGLIVTGGCVLRSLKLVKV